MNDQIRLAFLGDIEKFLKKSKALTDFVYESNHGKSCWFVQNTAELEHQLKS